MLAEANDSPSPLVFALTLEVDGFHREWSRCNLLANYVGEYVAYQFTQRERAENLISTITNEFLESVIALAPRASRLSLSYVQTPDELRIEADHTVHAEARSAYLDFLAGLDPDHSRQQYLELLIAEEQPADEFNQLGLTMLTHDFGVLFRVQSTDGDSSLHTQLVTPIEALIA
jgi:hypothetical protein